MEKPTYVEIKFMLGLLYIVLLVFALTNTIDILFTVISAFMISVIFWILWMTQLRSCYTGNGSSLKKYLWSRALLKNDEIQRLQRLPNHEKLAGFTALNSRGFVKVKVGDLGKVVSFWQSFLGLEHVFAYIKKRKHKSVYGGFAAPVIPIFSVILYDNKERDSNHILEAIIHEHIHIFYLTYGFQLPLFFAVLGLAYTLYFWWIGQVGIIFCYLMLQEFLAYKKTREIASWFGIKTRRFNLKLVSKYFVIFTGAIAILIVAKLLHLNIVLAFGFYIIGIMFYTRFLYKLWSPFLSDEDRNILLDGTEKQKVELMCGKWDNKKWFKYAEKFYRSQSKNFGKTDDWRVLLDKCYIQKRRDNPQRLMDYQDIIKRGL
jgi:hypothetical protein